MGKDIPKNWLEVELEQVSSKITDGTHKTPNYQSAGVRFISIKNIRPFRPVNFSSYEKYISTEEHEFLIRRALPEKGDILFPRIGTLGFAKKIDWDEHVSIFVGLGLIKPIKELVLPEFVEYYMNTPKIFELSHERSTGTGRMTLPLKESKKLPFPLAPLREQKRIVAKLDALFGHLDTLKAKLDRIPNLLKNFRQQVLTQAVTGKLTEEWRKGKAISEIDEIEILLKKERELLVRQKKIRKVILKETDKNDNLGELPVGWRKMSLIEVANVIDPNPSHRMPTYIPVGIPFLSTENIKGNELDFEKGKKVTKGTLEQQIKRYDIKDGDFIFTRIGTIGKSCYLPTKRSYALSHAVCVISTYLETQYHPSFLKIILSSQLILDQSQDGVQSVGVPDLGMGKVRAFQIPLTSVKEQDEIIKRVEGLFAIADRIESQYKSLKAKIDNLPQAILNNAFKGELVPQDPNDEPASVLLERIKVEKGNKLKIL